MMLIILKKLQKKQFKISGRNNQGKITIRHRGGSKKRNYRYIDFKRALFDIPALVLLSQYDPNRTAFILLLLYQNGFLSYILSPANIKRGDIIKSSNNAEILIGNCLELQYIPIGTVIHNIELLTGCGGKLCRAAGTFGILLSKYSDNKMLIKLSSGINYILFYKNLATVGLVSNLNHKYVILKKAGVNRNFGIRPTVRGVAMNPIDHPHGGGEGKTSGGRPSVSPWGKLTKGKKTRNVRKVNNFILKNFKILK